MSVAFTPDDYRDHGPRVVNLARQIDQLLYGIRTRRALIKDCQEHDEPEEVERHRWYRRDYTLGLRKTLNMVGGREAFRLYRSKARG